jgi:hypothetical protein
MLQMDRPSQSPTAPTESQVRQFRLLRAVAYRYATHFQPLRLDAIDSIVSQALTTARRTDYLTIEEIYILIEQLTGAYSVTRVAIRESVNRLRTAGVLETVQSGGQAAYRMSADEFSKIDAERVMSEKRLETISQRLFGGAVHDDTIYKEALLQLLYDISDRLGQDSASLLMASFANRAMLASTEVTRIIEAYCRDHRQLDCGILRDAIWAFFSDTKDPDIEAFKWHLVQSHYVTKLLGLGAEGDDFSTDLFDDSTFYLDTNIIISAVDTLDSGHRAAESLMRMLKKMNARVMMTGRTIDELQKWVDDQIDKAFKIRDYIPDQLPSRLDSIIFRIAGELDFDRDRVTEEVHRQFLDPVSRLKERYALDVEVDGDPWLEQHQESAETTALSKILQDRKRSMGTRPKSQTPAKHDALMLRYVDHLRKVQGGRYWFLTNDWTLPGVLVSGRDRFSAGILSDGILQWVGLAEADLASGTAARFGLSQLWRRRILPYASFLHVRDFEWLASVDLSCKDLPVDEVERFARMVRASAPELDPTSIQDQQRWLAEFSRHFADPQGVVRRTRQDAAEAAERAAAAEERATAASEALNDATARLAETESRLTEVLHDEARRAKAAAEHETQISTRLDEVSQQLNESQRQLSEYQRQLTESQQQLTETLRRQDQQRMRTLRLQARLIVAASVLVTISVCALWIFLSIVHGPFDGIYNVMLAAGSMLATIGAIRHICRWMLGLDRGQALGPRWKSVLGIELQ